MRIDRGIVMGYNQSMFKNMQEHCKNIFGETRGKFIYEGAERLLNQLLNEMDDRESVAIRAHMTTNMLPVIAYYLTLQKDGFSKEEAYEQTLALTQSVARETAENYKKIAKIPFAYWFFKLVCKKKMKKSYPKEGWDIEWIKYNKKEISFEMKSCVYYETVCKYQCPELCTVFCANDTTIFGAMAPKIIFKRNQTIGEGKSVCDFHYYNGKNTYSN